MIARSYFYITKNIYIRSFNYNMICMTFGSSYVTLITSILPFKYKLSQLIMMLFYNYIS